MKAEQQPAPADSTQEQAPTDDIQGQARSDDLRTAEEQQAVDQWLRRIPDDPSALLRRKFRYQYQQRDYEKNPDD